MASTEEQKMGAGLRRLLVAQVPADLADWLDYVAVASVLAFVWGEDTIVFAWFAVALGLPYVIVGPLAGVIVDRMDLKTVLVLSNLGRALATFSLILAPDWVTLLSLVALRASVDSFFSPAKQAAIQAMTEEGARQRANGLSLAINQGSKIVAPAAGGALIGAFAPQVVFSMNGVLSLVAAAIFLFVAVPVRGVSEDEVSPGFWQELRQGFAVISARPALRATVFLLAGAFFGMFFYDTLIPPLMRAFGHSSEGLGLLMAAVGLGGVAGAGALSYLPEAKRPLRVMAVGFVVSASLVILVGWRETGDALLPLWAILSGGFVVGCSTALSLVPSRTILQNETDPAQMSRVTSISEAVNTTALVTAPFAGAVIAEATSLGVAFIAGGCLLLVLAVVAARLRV